MTRLRWLLGTALRGLWARRVLSLGSLLLTVIAIASAVVGPSYQLTSANSFVITQLGAEPLITTGLTFDYHRSFATRDQTVDQAVTQALDASARAAGPSYLPGHALVWDSLPQVTLPKSSIPAQPVLVSAPGACSHVVLKGRCPTLPGQVAVLDADATTYGLKVGSRFNPYGAPTPFVVTGIYEPGTTAADDAFWFGPGRLQSIPGSAFPKVVASRPAPWITPQVGIELRQDRWYVTVDHALDVSPTLTPEDAAAAATRASALHRRAQHGQLPAGLTLEPGNVLPSTIHHLLARRGVARSTVTPAVLSLILVALVLLSRLLSAAMGLRRGELALASLRGYGRRQLWFLGMLEPLLILAAATPLGLVLGYLASRQLAARWLVPGLPVPFVLASALAVVAVVLVTALVAAAVVRDAVNEPLSAQIAGVRRPARASRLLVLVRLALLAAAGATLVTAAGRNKPSAPDATDLALPILLAIAAGLLSGLLILALAGLWVRWSANRRALSSYVAARTVRRRREGTLVILPLTAAMTIAVFTVGVSLAASTWRASAAATEVGAPLSYPTALTLSRAVGLTHAIDPQGRWLMAAAVSAPNTELDNAGVSSIQPRVVVDTPRMARVASWPSQWTPGESAAQVAEELGPRRPSVVLRGSRLSITVDNHVRGDYAKLGLSLDVLDHDGAEREVNIGPYPQGTSTATTRLHGCTQGCVLQTIAFGGPAALVEAMHGTATISRFTVDGARVPGALDAPWRIAAPQYVGSSVAVDAPPQLQGGRLHVSFKADSPSSYAGISPTDVPAVVPVLWGRLATQQDKLPTGASGTFRVHSVGTAESVPFRGPSGMLIDYTMFARNTSLENSTTQVYVWARADTPASVRAQLAAHGLSHYDTETTAKHLLDQDAFALALRLYVVVTALVILLALAGLGANLAVQLPARRRDAASLRVVGVKRRSVMIGVVAEFVVVLGAAALAGVVAGAVAQYLVVRSVTLGFADTEITPRVLPSFDPTSVAGLSAAVLAVLLVVASGFAVLTVRGARTSSLRENAR